MGSPLPDFIEAAGRMATAAGLDAIDLGVIWYERPEGPPLLLALRGELRRSTSREIERFDAEGLHARRLFVARADWEALASGLETQRLELGPDLRLGEYSLGGKLVNWRYAPQSSMRGRDLVYAARAAAGMSPLWELLGPEVYQSLTPLIARHSDYEIASFSRLAQRFVGVPLEDRGNELELAAPWPVREVKAARDGGRVRVEIIGIEALDPGRFIINIESPAGDRRLRNSEMQWATSPRGDTSRYVAMIDDPERACSGINVYFKGVEEVSFHTGLGSESRELGESLGSLMRRLAAPIPSGPSGQIVRLRVERFRSLRDVVLDLRELRVLIGPNQAGKSTVLDALAFLREAVTDSLHQAIFRKRGGVRQILWRGDGPATMQFEVEIEQGDRALRYELALGLVGAQDYMVEREVLHERRGERWELLISASNGVAVVDGLEERTPDPHELFLLRLPSRVYGESLRVVASTLAAIAVFPGFQIGASWVDPKRAEIRQSARIVPGVRLDPLAANLTAVLHSLSQGESERWEELLAVTRLVFPKLVRITFPAAEADRIQLAWHEDGVKEPFFAVDLSDGTLQFLALLCALYQPSSLIALDEPETHLHPEALYRWVGMAAKTAAKVPVLLATQSTQLLGFLDESPEAVVVVRRGENGTQLVYPSKADLEEWVKQFSLADMRQELEGWGEGA